MHRLPLELYTQIIHFIPSPEDLAKLCLVSKYFLQEARLRLYHSNKIPLKKVPKFTRTIANRPDIADLVRSLTLEFPPYFSAVYNEAGQDIIRILLDKVKNLKKLVVSGRQSWNLAALLKDPVYQLETFKTTVTLYQNLVDALESHKSITELTYRSNEFPMMPPIVFRQEFLPQLTILSCSATLLSFLPLRAISRLNVDVTWRETMIVEVLNQLGPTLVCLSLGRRMGIRRIPMIYLISQFARSAPLLRFLSINDDCIPTTEQISLIQNSSWMSLSNLQILVWYIEEPRTVGDIKPPHQPLSNSFVAQFEKMHLSLQRFIFVSADDDAGFTWDSDRVRKTIEWEKEAIDYTAPAAYTWA